jgi:hypothetical protein
VNQTCTKIGANFFLHIDKYFEYLLGDPSYMSKETFVMWQLKRCKLALGHDLVVLNAYIEVLCS